MSVPLYVVVPVRDQFRYTRDLVTQLRGQGEAERIFVFDNGSEDETAGWLDLHAASEGSPIRRIDARGRTLHYMWNAGLDLARKHAGQEPHHVAVLNNDLAVGPQFLSRLSRALLAHPDLGVVGGNYDGRAGEGVQRVSTICAGRYDGTGGLPGFAFMLRGEEGYRFPRELSWMFGDNDLVLTMLEEGRGVGLVLDAACEHRDGGGRTGDWQSPEWQAAIHWDQMQFARKWKRKRFAASRGT